MDDESPKIIFNIRFTAADEQRKEERKFYAGTSNYNIFNYVQSAKKVCKKYERYEDYINKCRTGLFNRKGVLSEEDLKRIRKDLATTNSLIWHGFISFNSEMSEKMQCQEDCVNFLKHNFNVIFEKSKINPDNIELIAGLHTDTEHRHIHFMFFEKKPNTINANGIVDFTKKGKLNMAAVEKFLVNGNLWLSGYEDEVYGIRDKQLKELKNIIPRIRKDDEKINYVKKSLIELGNMLPKTGRLGYNSKNISVAVRNKVDTIVSAIINANPNLSALEKAFGVELAKRENAIKSIAQKNHLIYGNTNMTPAQISIAVLKEEGKRNELRQIEYRPEVIEKIINDKKGRLGNLIIHAAVEMRSGNKERHFSSDSYAGKYLKINAKRKRQFNHRITLTTILRFSKLYTGIKTDFTKDLERVERQIEIENENKNRG